MALWSNYFRRTSHSNPGGYQARIPAPGLVRGFAIPARPRSPGWKDSTIAIPQAVSPTMRGMGDGANLFDTPRSAQPLVPVLRREFRFPDPDKNYKKSKAITYEFRLFHMHAFCFGNAAA